MAPYVSHPVRRIRADPVAGERVRLVVTVDGDDSTVAEAVGSLGGRVVATLQFDALLIEVPQSAVDDVCTLAAATRVETANTLSIRPAIEDSAARSEDSSPSAEE